MWQYKCIICGSLKFYCMILELLLFTGNGPKCSLAPSVGALCLTSAARSCEEWLGKRLAETQQSSGLKYITSSDAMRNTYVPQLVIWDAETRIFTTLTDTTRPQCEQRGGNQLEVHLFPTSKQGKQSQCEHSQHGSWPRKVGHSVPGHQLSTADSAFLFSAQFDIHVLEKCGGDRISL